METLGSRIQQYRSAKDMNQKDLADEIGLSQAAISHFEKDQRRPTPVILKKIADALDVSEEDLLGADESKHDIEVLTRNLDHLTPEAVKKLKELSEMLRKK